MHELRAATEADRCFIIHLHRAAFREYVEQTWGWDDVVQARLVEAWFAPTRFAIVVVDGQDVGALAVERRSDALILADLLLLPEAQGRGLGTVIVTGVLAEARERGLPVELRVLRVNERARRFYLRLGFAVVGETPTHHLMRITPAGTTGPRQRRGCELGSDR